MKKSYLMIAAAVLTFAACSNNELINEINVQNEAEQPIGFTSQYMEKQTKAEITTAWLTTNGSNFGVYGYRTHNATTSTLFSNEEVTYVSATPDWTHTTVRYWDKSATAEYDFYAYAPYKSTGVSFATSGTTTGFTYPLGSQVFADASAAATIDLCVARVEDTDYNHCFWPGQATASDGHVSFTFNHVLSKLTFSVKKEGFENAYTVTLKQIHVAFPTATTATWTQTAMGADAGKITYTGWANQNLDLTTTAGQNGVNQEVYNNNTGVTVQTTAAAITGAKEYIVTPNAIAVAPAEQEEHKIYLKVDYEVAYNDGNNTVDSQTAYGFTEFQFEQNYVYNLIVNIKPAKIEFDVDAVNGFTPADPSPSVDVQ